MQDLLFSCSFFLAICFGSAFHDTISTNIAWFRYPLKHINHLVSHPIPGAINAWIISTALLSLITIIALPSFIRYKGKGKIETLGAVSGTLVILIATFLYFVPTLMKIFEEMSTFSNEELISMSHWWIVLNFIRLFLLMALFFVGLIGLVKLANR